MVLTMPVNYSHPVLEVLTTSTLDNIQISYKKKKKKKKLPALQLAYKRRR